MVAALSFRIGDRFSGASQSYIWQIGVLEGSLFRLVRPCLRLWSESIDSAFVSMIGLAQADKNKHFVSSDLFFG